MDQQAVLSIPTVTLSIISMFCCVYVCYAIIKAGYIPTLSCRNKCDNKCSKCNKCNSKCTGEIYNYICCRKKELGWVMPSRNNYKKSSRRTISHKSRAKGRGHNMIEIIYWMCITDIFWMIFYILNWIPLTFHQFGYTNVTFWRGTSCKILGVYCQFLSVQSPLWHFLLAYNLGYLLLNSSLESLNKLYLQRYYQYFFVIIIPIITCIAPIGYYGVYENNNSFDKECWLKSEEWQLISTITILLSLLFHYIILILLCWKYQKYKKTLLLYETRKNILQFYQYKSVISRLSRFVFIYTIIRILPSTERIYECFTPNSPPFWLIVSHHICVSCIGIANFIAWNINQMDPATNLSAKKFHDQYKFLENKNNNNNNNNANESFLSRTDHDKQNDNDKLNNNEIKTPKIINVKLDNTNSVLTTTPSLMNTTIGNQTVNTTTTGTLHQGTNSDFIDSCDTTKTTCASSPKINSNFIWNGMSPPQ